MRSRRKNTYTGILGVHAWCEDEACGWKTEAKNALGTAARHADAHPDHEVHVEQVLGITYNRRTDEEVFQDNQKCYLVASGFPHKPHDVAVPVRGSMREGTCPGVPE
jgi:hypothetical protein